MSAILSRLVWVRAVTRCDGTQGMYNLFTNGNHIRSITSLCFNTTAGDYFSYFSNTSSTLANPLILHLAF